MLGSYKINIKTHKHTHITLLVTKQKMLFKKNPQITIKIKNENTLKKNHIGINL